MRITDEQLDRAIDEVARSMTGRDAPPGLTSRVTEAIDAPARVVRWRPSVTWRPAMAAVAIVIVAIVVLRFETPTNAPGAPIATRAPSLQVAPPAPARSNGSRTAAESQLAASTIVPLAAPQMAPSSQLREAPSIEFVARARAKAPQRSRSVSEQLPVPDPIGSSRPAAIAVAPIDLARVPPPPPIAPASIDQIAPLSVSPLSDDPQRRFR